MPKKPRWWRRGALYDQKGRGEHRVISSGHGQRPQYSRKMRRLLTRLFR